MKRLTTIAAATVLLLAPMSAKAEPTFLRCDVSNSTHKAQWDITLNEGASTVLVTNAKVPKTVLGGFSPESVTWTFVSGDIRMVFRLNRLTGEITNRMIVPSSFSKKNKERAKTKSFSGLCQVREAAAARMF